MTTTDNLVNPPREMAWDKYDPVIVATIDLVDCINDLQRAHNRTSVACGEIEDMRIREAATRRAGAIKRLVEAQTEYEKNIA